MDDHGVIVPGKETEKLGTLLPQGLKAGTALQRWLIHCKDDGHGGMPGLWTCSSQP